MKILKAKKVLILDDVENKDIVVIKNKFKVKNMTFYY